MGTYNSPLAQLQLQCAPARVQYKILLCRVYLVDCTIVDNLHIRLNCKISTPDTPCKHACRFSTLSRINVIVLTYGLFKTIIRRYTIYMYIIRHGNLWMEMKLFDMTSRHYLILYYSALS